MRWFMLTLIAFSCISCNRGAQYLKTVGDAADSATAAVYVINPAPNLGGTTKSDIYIDGFLIGKMGSNSHLKTTVAVGKGKKISIKTSARPDGEYAFSAEPNSVHYFEYETDAREYGPALPLLRKLSEEDGELLLAQVPNAVPYQSSSDR